MNEHFNARDLIALVVVVGAFILKLNGADGYVSMVLTSVVAFYFGLHLPAPQEPKV